MRYVLIALACFLWILHSDIYASETWEYMPSISYKIEDRITCGKEKNKTGSKDIEFKGHLADRGQFPWQVFLRFYNCHGKLHQGFCSGLLITPKTLLTTANCTRFASGFEVLIGRIHINNLEENGILIALPGYKDWLIHPNFTETTLNNNMALLFLPFSLPMPNEHFNYKMIRLPGPNELHEEKHIDGKYVTLSGWGTIMSSNYSETLMYVKVRVASNEYCNSVYGDYEYSIQSMHICVKASNETMCMTDYGSPIVFIPKDGVPTVVGILSYGACGPEQTMVGSRLAYYLPWINKYKRT